MRGCAFVLLSGSRETASLGEGSGNWLTGERGSRHTCHSPAITTVLQCLNRLKVPSVALYVVELPFSGGFESLPLRHTVWVAEKSGYITSRITENRRNSAGLAFKPHRRKCPVEPRGQVFRLFSGGHTWLRVHKSGSRDETDGMGGHLCAGTCRGSGLFACAATSLTRRGSLLRACPQ
jgi:hypothetical protein